MLWGLSFQFYPTAQARGLDQMSLHRGPVAKLVGVEGFLQKSQELVHEILDRHRRKLRAVQMRALGNDDTCYQRTWVLHKDDLAYGQEERSKRDEVHSEAPYVEEEKAVLRAHRGPIVQASGASTGWIPLEKLLLEAALGAVAHLEQYC